jgi:hypothetical protein
MNPQTRIPVLHPRELSMFSYHVRSSGSRRRTRKPSFRPQVETLEDRLSPAVALTFGGPGTPLSLTELVSGSTPTVTISDGGTTTLTIDLGAAFFDASSTSSASALTYQNAGSPTTSHFANVNISATDTILTLAASLAGDVLHLGKINGTGLDNLSVSGAGGSTEIDGASITTHGAQTYDNPVALAASASLISVAAASASTVRCSRPAHSSI